MNWGHRILLVFILFLTGLGAMVFIASGAQNEMIDANYYEKELAYQQQIDAANNLHGTGAKVQFAQSASVVSVSFPQHLSKQLSNASVDFLRLNNAKLDVHVNIHAPTGGSVNIDRNRFEKGMYLMRVQWLNEGIPYYSEENVFVQ